METLTWVPQFVNQTSEILLYVMQNTTEKQCLLDVPFSRVLKYTVVIARFSFVCLHGVTYAILIVSKGDHRSYYCTNSFRLPLL